METGHAFARVGLAPSPPAGYQSKESDPGLRQATRRKKSEAKGPQRLLDDMMYGCRQGHANQDPIGNFRIVLPLLSLYQTA
jgi:hypothetical protein